MGISPNKKIQGSVGPGDFPAFSASTSGPTLTCAWQRLFLSIVSSSGRRWWCESKDMEPTQTGVIIQCDEMCILFFK